MKRFFTRFALAATSGTLCTALILSAPAYSVGVPKPGPAPIVSLPARADVRLENGLIATLVPFGHVPKTTIVLTVGTGALADGAHPGLSRLAADLMKQGVRGGEAATLFRHAADLGGAVGISAGLDTLTVSIDVLAEHGPAAIALLADVLRRPTLPASELDRLKADLKRALAIARSQQQSMASEAFAHLFYGDGPRGRRIQDADVDAISITDIRTFVGQELAAKRTRIYVAGRYDASAIETALHTAFDDWSAGEPARIDHSVPLTSRIVQLIDRPGAKQSTILMGLPVRALKTPGFTDLSLANALLGGAGLLSRLDENLREEKGWTYGVQTQIEPLQDAALWVLFADVNTPDTAAAIQEIFKEIVRLSTTAPDDDELQRVQNYRAGHFLMGASSREGLIGQVQFVDRHELGTEWLTNYLQRLQRVTPEGVHQAAREIDPMRITVVVAGDLSKIKSEIEGIDALHGADFR